MLVQTRKQFDAAIDTLAMASTVAVDTETNGLKVHKGHRLCGVAVYAELKQPYAIGWYFPFRHSLGDSLFTQGENLPMEWLTELGKVLSRPDLITYWHNWKFDAGMLRADGIEIQGPIRDALVLSQRNDENQKHALAVLEQRFLGTNTKNMLVDKNIKPYLKGKKDYSKVPAALMEAYAVNDVRVTYQVVPVLVELLKQQEMWELWSGPFGEETFLRCLFELEWYGIGVDKPLAQQLSSEAEARMRTLEDEMGFDPQRRNVLACRLFFPPPEGLGFVAGPLTRDTSPEFPNGIPVLDEDFLMTLPSHPLIDSVIQYRRIVKRNSSWYKGFLDHSDTTDGRMHPSYNVAGDRDKYGTVTSRMSHSEPNIAQLPRDPTSGVRKLLRSGRTRCRHYVADYNQIEYRLAGIYSGEPSIIEAYRAGSDMHQLTADKLGIPRVDPMGKIDGKKLNFTMLYLAGVDRVAATLKIPGDEAAEVRKAWWANYPVMRKFAYIVNDTARAKGWIRMWDGHRRHFEGEHDYHKGWNSLIQGGAARIMQRSMCMLHPMQKSGLWRMIYQVHDALGFEIPNDFREDWISQITEVMEWPGADGMFGLPFPCDWKWVHEGEVEHICDEECEAA